MRFLNNALAAVIAAACALALGPAPAWSADNFVVKDGNGASVTMKSKDNGTAQVPSHGLTTADGLTLVDPATKQDVQATQANAGSDASKAHSVQGCTGCKAMQIGDDAAGDLAGMRANIIPPYGATPTTTITRPADTNVYAVNDTWADSTSAPTTGGFTLTGACRTSGGSGVITSATIVSSVDPTTLLQGEIWIFDSAPTAVNDNAAFALSDADAIKLVPGGVIPFTLASTTAGSGTNSFYSIAGLNIGFTCSGSANLRFLVKVKNGYTPASGEQLTVRLNDVASN